MVAVRPDTNSTIGQISALIGEDDFKLWGDNVAAVHLFGSMMTQWNVGPSGAIGLRYEGLEAAYEANAVERADRPRLFADLRVMEIAALDVFRGK